MANVTDLLLFGAKLSTRLAEGSGALVTREAREVLIDLASPRTSAKRQLQAMFCPKAKEPKMAVKYSYDKESKDIEIKFFDGSTPLSRTSYSKSINGEKAGSLTITNPKGQEHISVSGRYNPNAKFFDWDEFDQGFGRSAGYTTTHLDSTGFSARVKVRDESAQSVLNNLKEFFRDKNV